MYNKRIIKTGAQKHKAFLQNGFHLLSASSKYLHNHNCAEGHIVVGGFWKAMKKYNL